jgi:hypothetical protein
VLSICGHSASFAPALDELAGARGASVDVAASPVAPSTSPVHPTMPVVRAIGATVPQWIVVVGPPIAVEHLSSWMVGQLGTPVPRTMSVAPFRIPIVPACAGLKLLQDAFAGELGAAVPTWIQPMACRFHGV